MVIATLELRDAAGVIMADEDKSESVPSELGIHYVRSHHYRTIHADGAQIGITPQATVQISLFSDQKFMPEFVMHKITPEGKVGDPQEEVVKSGVMREVEINVIMHPTAVASLIEVLQGTLNQIREFQARRSAEASSVGNEEKPSSEK